MQIKDLREKYNLEVYTEEANIDYRDIVTGFYRAYSLEPFYRFLSKYYLKEVYSPGYAPDCVCLKVYADGTADIVSNRLNLYEFIAGHRDLIEQAIRDTSEDDWLCRIYREFRIEPVTRNRSFGLLGYSDMHFNAWDLSGAHVAGPYSWRTGCVMPILLAKENCVVYAGNGKGTALTYFVLSPADPPPDYKEVYQKLVQNFSYLKRN